MPVSRSQIVATATPAPLSTALSVPLDALRRRIAALEAPARPRAVIALGVADIDAALPWGGLPCSALHEVHGAHGDATAVNFIARVAAAARGGRKGSVLWCRLRHDAQERGLPYGPGLAALGLAPHQVMYVTCTTVKEVGWAMEEGLRAGVFAAVIGDGVALGITAARRLQLAAGDGPAIALLAPPPISATGLNGASFALTRWRFTALPAATHDTFLTTRSWQVDLLHCRGAPPAAWQLTWMDSLGARPQPREKTDAALSGAVVAALADGSLAARLSSATRRTR